VAEAWVFNIDPNGAPLWQRAYGGDHYDFAYSIDLTPDGGVVAAGKTYSFRANTDDGSDISNIWAFKLDENGIIEWEMSYGADDSHADKTASSIIRAQDGGYAMAGFLGYYPWVLKLDENGSVADTCPAGIGRSSDATVSELSHPPIDTNSTPISTTAEASGIDVTTSIRAFDTETQCGR
jgi:hypothetical protein